MQRYATVFLALFLFLIVARPATAQNEYEEQVMLQLDAAAEVFIDDGYEPLVAEGGALNDSESELFTVTLEAGYTYILMGVCDEDCSDLDLAFYDGNDELVVKDELEDDAPVIEFTVTYGGDFTLEVTMFDCGAEPCYYGVGLFGK